MGDRPKPTVIENAIHKVMPGTALQMYNKRVSYMMSTGAYEPNRPGNRPFNNYTKFLTSPNSRANQYQRQELVNYNRFLCQSSVGTSIVNRLTDHAIGNGLNFRASVNAEFLGLNKEQGDVKNQEFTRLWKSFFQAENGHYDRMYPGGYLQSIIFKSMLEGGDNFTLPVKKQPRNNHRFPFALQTFESERVTNPSGHDNDPNIDQGVEKNADGVPVKIHVAKTINGYNVKDSGYFNQQNWETADIFGKTTGIRQVFQLKNIAQDRPGALRGIPFLTPTMGLIIDHQETTAAVLKAAKIQSMFAGLWSGGTGGSKLGGAPGDLKTAGKDSKFPRVDLTAGQIIDMPEGYTLEGFQSTQPGREFTPFQMMQLALMGSITGIPRSFILMMFDKSYSASRGETAIFWTTVLRNRYAFVYMFGMPFWEYLLSWAVASGNVSAPGFFQDPEIKAAWLGDAVHQFSGPRMPQLDLEKEAKGLVALRDAGFKSTRGIIEESFTEDPDEVFREWKKEKEEGLIHAVAKQTQQLIEENESDKDDLEIDDE